MKFFGRDIGGGLSGMLGEENPADHEEQVSVREEEEEEKPAGPKEMTDRDREIQKVVKVIEHSLEDQQEMNPKREQQSGHNTLDLLKSVA